jgi:hypothetical protein
LHRLLTAADPRRLTINDAARGELLADRERHRAVLGAHNREHDVAVLAEHVDRVAEVA